MPKGEKNRKLSDEDLDLIERLYTTRQPDGTWVGVTTIARQFGVAHNAIQTRLRSRGVQMRTAKEAHSAGKRCKPIVNLPEGEPPLCRCGCGEQTPWNRRKKCWYVQTPGHRCKPWTPTGRPKGSPGSSNPAWKGGVTPLRQRLYKTEQWKATIRAVFARDQYVCQRCRAEKIGGVKLHAHHIASFAEHPDLRFALENLITLCASCHMWVHSLKNTRGDYLA